MRALDVHLVVHRAAGLFRVFKARADLDALDGLNRHHRTCETRVEAAIPLDVRTEAERQAARDDLERAAERVARRHRLADARLHAFFDLRVVAVQPVGVERRVRAENLRDIDFRWVNGHAADLRDVRDDADAERAQEFLAGAADGHAHRRFAGARTLEDVADVLARVFLVPREVGMAGPRRRDRLTRRLAERRHAVCPVLEIAVLDRERDRAAERLAKAHARQHLDMVFLDLHATAAPIALLPSREVAVDAGEVEREPGGQAFENRRQARAVRFAGRQKTQTAHRCHLIMVDFLIFDFFTR